MTTDEVVHRLAAIRDSFTNNIDTSHGELRQSLATAKTDDWATHSSRLERAIDLTDRAEDVEAINVALHVLIAVTGVNLKNRD